MRNKEQLNSKEFNGDMSDLVKLLIEKRIDFDLKPHMAASPEVFNILGYFPAGKDHIMIGDISIIRGMCSFGYYEAYGGKFINPERFETAQELVEALDRPLDRV